MLMAGKAGRQTPRRCSVRASGDNYTKALVTVANLMGVTRPASASTPGCATKESGSFCVNRALHVAIALIFVGCAVNDDVPGPSDETAGAGQADPSAAGTGGAQAATALGSGGKSGNSGNPAAAGVSGSAPSSSGTLTKDASLADAPIDAPADTGVTDPGTKGDGDFLIIGPDSNT